ncbi:MAG TPA: ribonuclease E inhibitor RraB [Gaiellaceae bacterium]|nr:ribonuclease E inhibitor RraB [Gaiellaceae bacterium]
MSLLDRLRRRGAPRTPEEVDRLVLRQLQARRADLTRPRHVIHVVYFAGEAQARAAAEEAERAGWNATVEPPREPLHLWCLSADAMRVVDTTTVSGFRAWFERLAEEHGGEYDGWEAAAKP